MDIRSVYERFSAVARRHSERPFFHVLEETAGIYDLPAGDITYAEMARRVEDWRAKLIAAGYSKGHRIGLLLQNRPVFLELFLAINSFGGSIVPINPDLRVAELSYLADHSEMVLAIVLPERVAEMARAIESVGGNACVMAPGDNLPEARKAANDDMPIDASSECALMYTSGTTGRPKGCILSNQYFLFSGDWYAEQGGLMKLGEKGERMLTPLPLFHMNALATSMMAMMTIGGCLIMLDRFHPRSWWQSVRESGATCVHYLGVMPAMLIGAEPSPSDRDHAVRFGFGAGVDTRIHDLFEERFGFPLLEAWAMTETGSGACICAHEEPRKTGTSCFGRPTPAVEVRVVDDSGADATDGLPGELLVRHAGDNPRLGFFSGYLKDKTATDEVWAGGWFHTGDVVSQDADGSLHFVDRKKNVIRRSGENIAAVEVESILNRHPDIRLSAAAAVPDAVRGDEVGVFLVMETTENGAEAASNIVDWALDQMAYYKVPGWVAFVESLPLTATQKIQRGSLKELVAQTREADGFFDTRALKKRRV